MAEPSMSTASAELAGPGQSSAAGSFDMGTRVTMRWIELVSCSRGWRKLLASQRFARNARAGRLRPRLDRAVEKGLTLSEITTRDRFRGCLLGLAAGDALGTTLEFRKPGTFDPIDDLVGGGPFRLKPGQWTDDTSMALCLATSLVERGGFDPMDQIQRYVRWWREGYLSSIEGHCFDIGTTVSNALSRFERTGEPYAGSSLTQTTAGNGSLMRLAPVPMYFAGRRSESNRQKRRQLPHHSRYSGSGRRLPLLRWPASRRSERRR